MITVTCAIIVHQNKILITQRGKESDHPLQWEFPGGKLIPGETVGECIVREIKEELDIDIEIRETMRAVEFDYRIKKIKLIPFLCKYKSGKIKLAEHIDFKWVEFENLEKFDFSEADQKLLRLEKNRAALKKYFGKNMDNTR